MDTRADNYCSTNETEGYFIAISTIEALLYLAKLSMTPEHNVTVTREGFTRNGPLSVDPEGVARLTFFCELPSCEVGGASLRRHPGHPT